MSTPLRLAAVVTLTLAAGTHFAAGASAAGPALLSHSKAGVDVRSSYGSGSFGSWRADRFGLPSYRYAIDPAVAPQARQTELAGGTDAWHQLGNDHIVATAHNEGFVQLWSQDRAYQWANKYEPGSGHFAGGYGYLRARGRTISTLYADRAASAGTRRDFGAGYFHRATIAKPAAINEHVYAPFGDAPLLLHDVTIRNTSNTPLRASWFEYWDANPYDQYRDLHLGLESPTYSKSTRTLSVAERADAADDAPLSIFASALRGKVAGWETDGSRFFGSGGRAAPDEVTADSLGRSIAPSVEEPNAGSTMFAFRSPVLLRPGQSVTLRYAYGISDHDRMAREVKRERAARRPFERSQHAWARYVPKARFGKRYAWLSRELEWDAYMLRSGATNEESCGHHIVSQGGYYQYDFGWNAAFRDPLQHALPLIYSDPSLAREVLLYSAQEQALSTGEIPYGMTEMCRRLSPATSNDLDLWLLLTASEYGLASRDNSFFNARVPWRDGGTATLWTHLKRAFDHQESLRGPHGGYLTAGTDGDWSDLSTTLIPISESMLVTAQTAYVYPRLAELADARGDHSFAVRLRDAASKSRAVLRREWTGAGWASRGYYGNQQVGHGVIYGEPQPWDLLAGVLDRKQDSTLVANIRRFLTGIGAPAETHGPAKIGSSMSPARNDPDVTERTAFAGLAANNAVFPGEAWYSVNGWLTWALGELDGTVPHARRYAFDELRRNTLAAHASAYPDHWDGVTSVDDVCYAHYEADPSRCGIGFTTRYDTQIMHQSAWSLFDVIRLAGIEPTRRGYSVDPHLPMKRFSVRMPRIGVEYGRRVARGYVRLAGGRRLRMTVALPPGGRRAKARAFVNGERVKAHVHGATASFSLRARHGKPGDWAVATG